MWLLFLYFIRIALIDLYAIADGLVVWLFAGTSRPYVPSIDELFSTLQTYGAVILLNGAILIIWARYNQHRFSGPDERLPNKLVTVADLAELYRLPAADITRWQASRILVMTHGPDGSLDEVTLHEPRPLSAEAEQGTLEFSNDARDHLAPGNKAGD